MRKMLTQYALPALFLALAATAPAKASPVEGAQASLKAALEQFEALLKEESAKTSPPRLADAKVKPVFDALLDKSKILGEHPYKAADVEPLLGIFNGYFNLTKTYLGFQDPKTPKSAADNEVEYQDELTRLAQGMVAASGAVSEALTDYVKTTPAKDISEDRKGGLAKLRMGVSQMISGIITLLQNPRYSKENKVLLATAIAEAAPFVSATLPAEERKNFSQTAMQSMLNTPKEAEAPINEFMNAMNGDDCTGLCALK